MGHWPIYPTALFSKLKHPQAGVSFDRTRTALSAFWVRTQFTCTLPHLTWAVIAVVAFHAASLHGAAAITSSTTSPLMVWNQAAHTLVTLSGAAWAFAATSVILFWAGVCLTVVFLSLVRNVALKVGLVGTVDTLASTELPTLGGLFSKIFPGQDHVLSADKDLDLLSSTDFEDLLVFTLDALELVWQDVNLVVDLCGDNLFVMGVGVFATGSAFLLYRKAFALKKTKR